MFKKNKYKKLSSNESNYSFNKKRIIISTKKNKLLLEYNTKKKKKSNKYFVIFILVVILLIIILLVKKLIFNQHFENKDNFEDIKPSNESIYFEEKFDDYKEAFNKAKDFIDKCMNGVLINKEKIRPSENPKISADITCYNCKDYILRAIRSIQNQNISDVQIVIINDFSSDDTLIYLKELQKEENRIRLVNNRKNMGCLYSKAIGALLSKGKYIFSIDSDDILLDKDVFSTVTNIADKGNFDIVIFEILVSPLSPNVNTTSYRKDVYKKQKIPNMVKFQPELGYYPIQPKNSNNNVYMIEVVNQGKCFKAEIYKEAINKIGEEAYSRYMDYDDDILINYVFFQIAKSMKYVEKYGYIYIQRKGSATRRHRDMVTLHSYRIYVLDILIKFSQNTMEHKKILVSLLNYFFQLGDLKDILNSDEYKKNLFISCIDRILNCEYISNDDKDEIRKKGKSLDFIKYNF